MLPLALVDEAALCELADALGPDGLNEAVCVFLSEMELHLRRLTDAEAAGDIPRMTETAHSIKGSAGTLGLTGLAMAGAWLESSGRALLAMRECRPQIDAVRQAYSLAELRLERLVGIICMSA